MSLAKQDDTCEKKVLFIIFHSSPRPSDVLLFSLGGVRMEKKLSCTLAGGKVTDVLFANDIKDLSSHLSSYGNNVFWVFDNNSAALFSSLPEKRIVLESGERYKTMESLGKILSAALSFSSARDTRFIAFGGGVVCDMTALAASLYMRGARLTLVPTTLLCMVDASLGGKTAIDFEGGKNLVGTFYPADEVLISIDTLRTLPAKEYKCGLGEVVKHAFLAEGDELFRFMDENSQKIISRDKEVLTDMVFRSLVVKKTFIEADPTETRGIRSFLNLGHTFAHALESMGNYTVSHGEAVAWGISRALDAGVYAGVTDASMRDRALSMLKKYGFAVNYRIGRGDWLAYNQALAKDKKKISGSIKFVLLSDFGKPLLIPLEQKFIQSAVMQSAKISF